MREEHLAQYTIAAVLVGPTRACSTSDWALLLLLIAHTKDVLRVVACFLRVKETE